MNNCPKCRQELVEGSVICPNCGEILVKNSAVQTVEDEIERLSMMAFNLENHIDVDNSYISPTNNVGSVNTTAGIADSPAGGSTTTATTPAEETPVVVETAPVEQAPLVFSKSKNRVKKVDDSDTKTEEKVDDKKTEDKVEEKVEEQEEQQKEQEEQEEKQETVIEEVSEKIQEENEEKTEETETIPVEDNFALEGNEEDIDLEKIFEEMTNFEKEFKLSEGDDLDTSHNSEIEELASQLSDSYEFDSNDSESDTEDDELNLDDFDRYNRANLLTKSNAMEEMLKQSTQSENIEKNIAQFFEEIKEDNDTHEDLDENKQLSKETYLKLNFVTTDKFATLITSDNERLDDQSTNTNFDTQMQFTDILDVEAIMAAEKLSEEELESTIQAVNIQKVELISSLEEEEKANTVSKYRKMRTKMFRSLKILGVLIMIFMSYYFASYVFDFGFFEIHSKLYLESSIENYDYVIYDTMLEIRQAGYEVADALEQYELGLISKDELISICDERTNEINEYNYKFDKHVYDEADDYIFKASNVYFFASYYIDNVKSYAMTGDQYYLDLNNNAKIDADSLTKEVSDARIEFLKSFGYTDEEINILNYKINNAVQDTINK